MKELRYKTRENSTPRSKPDVLFACHPNDFERDFTPVTDDILRTNNCAIWYAEDQNAFFDSEASDGASAQTLLSDLTPEQMRQLELTLGQMQLLVIPVTENFVGKPSFARGVLLPFAIEKRIPVLPIITEANETLPLRFNAITDGLQMLNRIDADVTAIPYEEKLEKFVNSVLVSNETAEMVRQAFDAYVFLSYRKKDRAHANALMRRIHENPAYEHIAIWFDEYLVPGESFTSGIEKALAQSPIFAMAVTEHLLEEGNYVKEHEYKAADQSRKIIVPVDMVGLNDRQKQMMREWYDRIPTLQDFSDGAAFHERFLDALKRAAIRPGARTAEHNFFMGLAYLMGIDVEVNRPRAVELIQSAAKDGYPEASQKLVYMYRNGDGVERSEAQELFWQEFLVGQRKAEYDLHPDVDLHLGTASAYFRALIDLSDMYKDRNRIADAIAQAETARALRHDLIAEVGVREAGRDDAVVLNRLGSLYRQSRDLARAESCYRQSLDIYEQMSNEITTNRARRDLSIGYEKLGDLQRALKKTDDAIDCYQKSKDLRAKLAEENPTTRARRDLSVISTKLGSACKDADMLLLAEREYETALIMDRQLRGELGTLQSERDLSISLEKLSRIYMKNPAANPGKQAERLQMACDYLRETVALREKILDATGKESARQELEIARTNLAKAERKLSER